MLDSYPYKIKTGDILLVHSERKISRAIQWFERIEDDIAGYWNHSAIFVWINNKLYVCEADYLRKGDKKSKFIAALKFTNFNDYLELLKIGEVQLKHLELIDKNIDNSKAIDFCLQYQGTLYDYKNFFSQIYRTIINGFVRRYLRKNIIWRKDKNGDKGFICHEWTQFFHNHFLGIFPNWSVNAVTEIYYEKNFKHHSILNQYENNI